MASPLKEEQEQRIQHHAPSAIVRWFLIVVISGLIWRLIRYFLNFEMSIDECYIMNNVIPRGYGQLLNPLDYAQVSPPIFLWATKGLDAIFGNEWGVRLLPLLAGLGALGMFWLLSAEVLRGAARWMAWAIFSVSFVPIEEGACTKGYTIDLLAATVMLWVMLRWLRRGQRVRELVWLGLLAPVAVWLSYTSVFVIGAIGVVFVAFILVNRAQTGRRTVLAGGAFLALAGGSALWLYAANIRPSLLVSKSSGLQDFWQMGYPPLHQPWKIPLWLLQVHTGRGFAWPIGDNHFLSTLTFVLWVTGLAVYWKRESRWVWALFVAPHVLLLTAAFLHKYPYGVNPRICMFLGPGICLFLGLGLQHFLRRFNRERRQKGYRVVALVLLMIALGGMAREVALRIREMKGPGIRSTLVDTSRLAAANGRFVVLNPVGNGGGEMMQILTYYLKRDVAQPVSWHEEIPPQIPEQSNLVVVAVIAEPNGADPFSGFEKRFGKPMTQTWSQVAHQVSLGKNKGRMMVRIYHVEP